MTKKNTLTLTLTLTATTTQPSRQRRRYHFGHQQPTGIADGRGAAAGQQQFVGGRRTEKYVIELQLRLRASVGDWKFVGRPSQGDDSGVWILLLVVCQY